MKEIVRISEYFSISGLQLKVQLYEDTPWNRELWQHRNKICFILVYDKVKKLDHCSVAVCRCDLVCRFYVCFLWRRGVGLSLLASNARSLTAETRTTRCDSLVTQPPLLGQVVPSPEPGTRVFAVALIHPFIFLRSSLFLLCSRMKRIQKSGV